jgi:hypothetical protein
MQCICAVNKTLKKLLEYDAKKIDVLNNEKDFTIISNKEDEIKLMIEALRAGLEKLFNYFSHIL